MNKAELIKALAELFAEKMELGEEPTNAEVIQVLFPNTTFKDAFIDTFAEITFVGSGYALLKKEWLNQEYNGSFAVYERW